MPAPGGINAPLYVYDATAGTWKRRTSPDYIKSAGFVSGWAPIKRIFRAVHTSINPSTLLPETTWAEVVDYRSPAGISVPGAAIAKRSATQITYGARASWTVITDSNDVRNACQVSVIFVNTTQSTSESMSVDQSVGSAQHSTAWDLGDQVYASLLYVNDNGSGTTTTTSTVTLGP